MKIKLLFVPTLIILSVFIAIHYIKPAFDDYMQKRSARDTARYQAENIAKVTANAQTLKGALDQNQDAKTLLERYLPKTKDQARAIDNLNYLTSQAGMVTTNISFVASDEEQAMGGQAGSAVFATPADGGVNPDGTPLDPLAIPGAAPGETAVPLPYVRPEPKPFLVQLQTIGAYQNIKDLLAKVQGLDRLQKISSYKIEKSENGDGLLKLTLTSNLLYLSETPNTGDDQHVVSVPVFQGSELPLSEVDAIRSQILSPVADTQLGSVGNANPFD
jgi:Tfp pilus assembly protein PilO